MIEATENERRMLVQRVLRTWLGDAQLLAEPTGPNMALLAEQAVDVLLTPQQWASGDTIPDDVDTVEDCTLGMTWERVRSGGGADEDTLTRWWRLVGAPELPEEDLLAVLGPVWESTPAEEPVGQDGPTQVRGDRCAARHPDYGWECTKDAGHPDGSAVHHDANAARSWSEPPLINDPQAVTVEHVLTFLDYLIVQGSAPGTATITKRIVNVAQARAKDLAAVQEALSSDG